jgi:hypothetical protein
VASEFEAKSILVFREKFTHTLIISIVGGWF